LARRNPPGCFIGGPKRRKQPERYAQYVPKNIYKFSGENILTNIVKLF
jgi:hypothetical protein